MPKIQSKYAKKFNPFFTTVINGSTVQLTVKELEENPRKYIKTSVGYMYEGSKKLAADLKKREAAPEFTKLNMNHARRGDIFDKEKREANSAKHLYNNDFLVKQEKKRKRIKSLSEKNLLTSADQKADSEKKTAKKAATEAAKKKAAENKK